MQHDDDFCAGCLDPELDHEDDVCNRPMTEEETVAVLVRLFYGDHK